MSRLMDLLLRSGRRGGGVVVGLGLVCGVAAVMLQSAFGFLSLFCGALGLLSLLVGGVLLVHGDPESGDFKAREAAEPSPELLAALQASHRPFFFCTRCRMIGDVGLCPGCKKGLDCLEIRDDEDLRLALLALT